MSAAGSVGSRLAPAQNLLYADDDCLWCTSGVAQSGYEGAQQAIRIRIGAQVSLGADVLRDHFPKRLTQHRDRRLGDRRLAR